MNDCLWYQTIPTFKNQNSKTLESFLPTEKYEDELFFTYSESLIDENVYQEIINNYNSHPDNKYYKEEKEIAEKLKSVKLWKRISTLFPDDDYDVFPSELHCDTFEQGEIGDCYFVDMISLLSNYGELIKRLFPIKKKIFKVIMKLFYLLMDGKE